MRSLVVPCLTTTALALVSCQRPPMPNETAVLAVVRENVAAMEREDLAGVMATIHSQSPAAEPTREMLADLFQRTDLRYVLSDLKVVESDWREARVSFTQRTEPATKSESPIGGNTVTGVHILRAEGGRWKIFSTPSVRINQLEPLITHD